MTWVYLDDRWDIGRKMLKAMAKVGDSAPAMWSRGITQCNRDLSDGRIDGDVLRSKTSHKNPQAVIEALIGADLLHSIGDDQYEFHDYLDWNDSRAEVESRREQKRANASKGGKESARLRGTKRATKTQQESNQDPTEGQALCLDPGTPAANQNVSTPELTPSPSPSPSGSSNQNLDPPVVPHPGDAPKPTKSTRGTRCPSSTSPEAPAWLEAHGIPALGSDQGAEAAKMLDHFAALGGSKGAKLDWPATWRNWLGSGFPKVRGPAPGYKSEPRQRRQDEPPPSPLMLLGESYTGPTATTIAGVLAVATGGTLKAESE